MREESSDTVKVYYPEFDLEELTRRLRKGIKTILKHLPLKRVILFGSYAEGKNTAASDVDLLIVYEDPKREGAYGICWDALKIPQLELFIYTASEYEKMKMRKTSIAREVERKGIIIWRSP